MELPDPYLPGYISLFDQLAKKMLVVLRDGRKLIGCLQAIDNYGNLVLDNVTERLFIDKFYCETPQGVIVIRGENIELAGEIDESINTGHVLVSLEDFQRLEEEHNLRNFDVKTANVTSKSDENDT